ncbi:MAG TPA: type II secretion system F family protein [Streptosporangiaceae bacterium]|nr:type II secretion system F family protein [Streptosporangiaceae bacterium]
MSRLATERPRARAALAGPAALLTVLLAGLAILAVPLALGSALPLSLAAARAAASPPRVVMILLDTNNSPPATRLPAERRAALDYARALPADVEVGLITFGDRWKTVLPPAVGSRQRLPAAVAAAGPAGATSNGISGALAAAVAEIGRAGPTAAGRVLVLSNGETLSHPPRAIAVPTDVVSWYDDPDDFPALIRRLATASGGRIADPAHAAALAGAFPALPKPSASAVPSPGTPATAQPTIGQSWHLQGLLLPALGAIFAALLILGLMATGSLRTGSRRPRLARQIARYGPMRTPAKAPEAEGDGKVARTAVGLMGQVLRSRDVEPKLAARLDHAGIQRQPAEWALLGLCVTVALAAALTVLSGNALLGVLVGIVVGWLGTRLFVSVKIARRRAAFDEQLPNVLQLVASSLQTGLSLSQAIDAVVREESQPAAGEFARALTETRLGVDLDVALDGVADRLASVDLRWVVMAIRIQRETGGNLAEVIRNTVATMRERAYLRRQVRSLSAEGRLSAYVLLALPVFVGGWLLYSSPNYMRPLYSTGFGVLMLVVAGALIVVGAFWMRKLINVEV